MKCQIFGFLTGTQILASSRPPGTTDLLDGTAVAVVVEEVGGGGEVVGAAVDLACRILRVEELLALLLDEALDLEQLGDLEEAREVVLRHVDLPLVHVVQDRPDLLVLDVLNGWKKECLEFLIYEW